MDEVAIEIGGTEETEVTTRVTKGREDQLAEETQWHRAETSCAGRKRGSSGRTQLDIAVNGLQDAKSQV